MCNDHETDCSLRADEDIGGPERLWPRHCAFCDALQSQCRPEVHRTTQGRQHLLLRHRVLMDLPNSPTSLNPLSSPKMSRSYKLLAASMGATGQSYSTERLDLSKFSDVAFTAEDISPPITSPEKLN